MGGVSTGPWASCNLGTHVGDAPPAVAENRARLRERLGLALEPAWLEQVHGTTVVGATATTTPPTADASIGMAGSPPCVVMTADCLPVLFCDDRGGRVAAAHAGWRGLAAGVLEATVAALAAAGAAPQTLMAWFGPAISGPAYEVGDDVRAAFLAADARAAIGFRPNDRGRWQLDLEAIARRRLVAAGVTRHYGGGYCTHGDSDRFFSHRRDGRSGRQATLVWIERPLALNSGGPGPML